MKNNEFFKKLGQQVQTLREKSGLSQTDLAKMVDVDSSVLSKFENKGQKLPADRINQIVNALGYELTLRKKNSAKKNALNI